MKKPELLAPAGDWPNLAAAIDNGADAVYLGVNELNMRKSGARNFKLSDIKKISALCRRSKVKLYVTLNTVVFDSEIAGLERTIKKLKDYVDALIVWDLAIVSLCRKYKINCFLSTQASVANNLAAAEYKKLGIKRIILARELSLKQISKIEFPKEIFIHGALCYSISGRCFFSQEIYGKSANRGECVQPCRRNYILLDPVTNKKIKVENDKFMSPKDLCCLPFLDKVVKTGVCSLKIEGRARSPEYVAHVVRVYRTALDAVFDKRFNTALVDELMKDLEDVYNRGFSSGFYLGTPHKDDLTKSSGNTSSKRKIYVGKVVNYYKKKGVAVIRVEDNGIKIGDTMLIIGNKTGVYEISIKSMEIEGVKTDSAGKGLVGVLVDGNVRTNDQVYLWN